MGFQYSIVIGVLLLAHHILEISSRIELTNLKCIPRDEKFILFEYCRIKSVNRTYKYFSVHAKLLQGPVSNITINVATYKRYNGYKPSLYNFTVDACKFMATKNKNPLYNYFYDFIRDYSNLNHTCPYDNDLIIDKVTIGFLNHQATVVLLPKGDYAVFTSWYAYGKLRGDIRFYSTLS